jgi:protein SCO1/2
MSFHIRGEEIMIRLISAVFILFSLCRGVGAFVPTENKSSFDPSILKIDEDAFLGQTVPDVEMIDETARRFRLSELGERPTIISLVYYSCRHTCPVLNEGLAEALRATGLKIGSDFNVVTISFDHNDTPDDAKRFRENVRKRARVPDWYERWIFAVASESEIKRLTDAVGYRFFYSRKDRIFVHPNVYIFLSPERKITRYIYGLYPASYDIRLASIEAADGRIGKSRLINTALLACYKYDPSAGSYTLNMPFVFGMFALSTGIFTGIVVFFYSRKMRRQRR